jgi:Septum formation
MSTEATGDGGPDTVGALEQDTTVVSGPARDDEADGRPEDADGAENAGGNENAGGAEDADGAGDAADTDGAASDEDNEDERALSEDEDFPAGGESADLIERAEPVDLDETGQARPARRWPRVLLAFGFVVLALAIVGGAVAIVGSVTHGFKKPVKVTYKKAAVFSLKTGDCFDPKGDQSYTLTSCDSAHVAEVFATFALTGAKWPGTTAVAAEASSGCATRLTSYLNPQLAISLASTYVYPDSVAWTAGTRTVICEVRASSGDLTGSVKGASTTAG